MDDKYGQLYTREDVLKIVDECFSVDVESEEDTKKVLEEFEGHFPSDEPLFLLRGKDRAAEETIIDYEVRSENIGASPEHVSAVGKARIQFTEFAKANPDRMKVPD